VTPHLTDDPPPVAAPVGPARAGLGRRVLTLPLRAAARAVGSVRRRPSRAAGYLALLVLLAGSLAAGGAGLWFTHHLRAARGELTRGHNAAALRHLARCQSLRPDGREVLLLSARVARRSGAADQAEALLDRCQTLHGEGDDLVLERLLLRATRGDVEEVGPALLARIRAGGADAALAREALVVGLLERFAWAEAFQQLDEWLAIDPDATAALLLRGKLEEQRQAPRPARELYQRVVDSDPDHDEARLRLTTLQLSDRHGAEAFDNLTVLRRRLPGHPEVAVQYARALALLGRNDESRTALDDALRAHPDYPAALAERGTRALFDGDEDAAERYLARAAALEPGNAVVRAQYALVLTRTGKRAEAAQQDAEIAALKADFERVTVLIGGPLQERPNDPAVHHEIGEIALRAGQVREALRWFTSAVRADPRYAPAHRSLALLYHALGKPVLSAHHRALAQRPKDAPAQP
jgi:tetratricopeptide (TPR) repeat protein